MKGIECQPELFSRFSRIKRECVCTPGVKEPLVFFRSETAPRTDNKPVIIKAPSPASENTVSFMFYTLYLIDDEVYSIGYILFSWPYE